MKQPTNELRSTLRACRMAIIAIAFASALVNVLYLTGAIYMMEVYDRVLASRSVPTLIGLSILALGLFAFQGILDILRGRLLIRTGRSIGDQLGLRVYHTIGRLTITTRTASDGLQPLRDIDQIRNFLAGAGPLALLDLPWIIFYIGACFLLHFSIGITALVGASVLISLTLIAEALTRTLTIDATTFGGKRNALAEASRRNAEVLHAMGFAPRFGRLWEVVNQKFLDCQQRVTDVTGGLGALSKVTRLALQSCILGVGAYLVIHQQATAGIIIAGSIISARALAPVDLAIANWRGLCCISAELGAHYGNAKTHPNFGRPNGTPEARTKFGGRGFKFSATGRTNCRRAGRHISAGEGKRSRNYRTERRRQVKSCARAGRRVDTGAR